MNMRVFHEVRLSLVLIAILLILYPVTASLPVAGFVSDTTSGNTPLAVRFTDRSTNTPVEWIWSFGDGETSALKNPTHTFARPGTYSVTLAATNAEGSNTVTMAEFITATRPVIAPVASFVPNVTSGTAPVAVQFLDTSSNSPSSSVWSFGDGSTYTGSSPVHIYTTAGLYTVTLTSANAAGSNSVTRTGCIAVSAPVTDPPVAGFVSTANTGTVPQTVQFVDASTNFPVSWLWMFGDGGTSALQNPSHTYTRIGTYNVSLTAANAWGDTTITKENYVVVNSPIPLASFDATPSSGPAPLTVRFTDTSTNSPSTWSWEFGDGHVSAIQNPEYVYSVPGVYTVSLLAMNAAGRGSITRSNYITVTTGTLPLASFTSDVREGSAPLDVRFTDTSSGNPVSWAWSFGDGAVTSVQNPSHTYMNSGSYTVTLTAKNTGGSNTSVMTGYVTVYGSQGATPGVRETAVPDGPSAGAVAVPVTNSVLTLVSEPVFFSSGLPGGIPLWIPVLALLVVAAAVALWWLTRPPAGSHRRRDRDL
jgi:PKD repeat protein